MTHFMIDLETMGNDATSPIVAIGCVAFKTKHFLQIISKHNLPEG